MSDKISESAEAREEQIANQMRNSLHKASQPITTILMLSELLFNDAPDPATLADLKVIYEQANLLKYILNNLNELVKELRGEDTL